MTLRERVCNANRMLPKAGLVTMHSGNVSGLDRSAGRLYIKPSGMDYDAMIPADMVEVDLVSGEAIQGQRKPSVDLSHHIYLFKNDPSINAVVHTHSNYATAFAAAHRSIPCVLTAISDEFGGEIPCAPYIDNEGDHIGEAILKHRSRGPAILLGNHGVFAWGETVEKALKAAIMIEDVAKTVHLSLQLGAPIPIAEAEVEKWWNRYHTTYGQ
ncbi:MAG: L-ribulose-5-phosphate 4-epimerase [Armatimonadota bacterium]